MSRSLLSPKRPELTPSDVPVGEFAVSVEITNVRAVLRVRGAIDGFNTRDLVAILDAVIERHRAVVLDLAALDFMSSSGLEVIVTRASRLNEAGGTLTIQSPSAVVLRMLEVTGVGDLVRLKGAEAPRSRLGAAQSSEVDDAFVEIEPKLPRHLGAVTAIPADADVVDGALRLVVTLARATVPGADGVSVSLRRHGVLATVAASDQTIADMDACQYATGEGPCVDASVNGRWFHAESLGSETRWPAFTPRAQALGVNAILSSPLLAEDMPVGALNIYSRNEMAFVPDAQELASVFAVEASLILTRAGLAVTDEQLAQRLGESLRIRRVIAQAEGVIMEREGIGADEAYAVLCDYSRLSNRPFRDHARDVTASTFRPGSERGEDHDG